MAVINNVAYSWTQVRLTSPTLGIGEGGVGSMILAGVSGIKYKRHTKVESNYGMGGQPNTRGFGNTTYEASITMDYATQLKLRGNRGSLMELGEFDLIISFANEMGSQDWTTQTVTLKGCIFNEDGLETKQDDTDIKQEFKLNPFRIIIGDGNTL